MLLLVMAIPANAQKRNAAAKKNVAERDTVALFRGFSVSVDAVGPVMMAVSDYGQYEAALHLNLRDRYFPVVEVGYGKADHTEENTQMSYKTSAPFFRAGMDFNVLKNKHDIYRLYVGARYAFTSYKYDLASPGVEDPVWGGVTPYEVKGAKCNYHWLEAALGVDVKLVGPLHLGWSLRYKQKLTADEGKLGKSWYVPGFGKTGTTAFGALFNISLDI
ncbi:hypothetical protein ST42_10885 [Prevotella pectinovora]|uniref:Outer membrane protein beta-barrel domain-containing protein n=2 Tax=Prevotella pectinovora TaxID=1602169 RepID=A0A0D0I612_9BACT|nr:hypothetical protein ST42_10885 [Prevotella pectinovora]KIP59599.1 hypothetical protein ST43_04980 [Prevotella pectinovora]KIP62735.1 hypothetical protein ST44_05795 [Prevotella pectinovora]